MTAVSSVYRPWPPLPPAATEHASTTEYGIRWRANAARSWPTRTRDAIDAPLDMQWVGDTGQARTHTLATAIVHTRQSAPSICHRTVVDICIEVHQHCQHTYVDHRGVHMGLGGHGVLSVVLRTELFVAQSNVPK